MFRCFISSFHFTYIPVERSPNWDNVALHDTSCLISMKISFQCCLTSMDVTFSVRNKCFLSFHHVAVSFSGSLWDCVTSTLGDWEQQHLVPYMERLVKILLWGDKETLIVRCLIMAQMAIHEAKKVLRREIKKRVAAMTDETKLKESTSIVNQVSWS